MDSGLSFDIVTECRKHRDMLKAVHMCGKDLYNAGSELDRAIEAYEKCFIPRLHDVLMGKTTYEAPTLEVAWIWHLHKLDPHSYIKDCQKAFGGVLHIPEGASPFTFMLHAGKDSDYCGKKSTFSISCSIQECAMGQSTFLWQVSGANYEDEDFLNAAALRYVMMLSLMRKHHGKFIIATYDMDIMWHTHLAFPQHYAADCKRLVGEVVGHDGSVNDRVEGTKLNISASLSCDLFFEEYGFTWEKEGGMYRGEPPKWYWSDRHRAASMQVILAQ